MRIKGLLFSFGTSFGDSTVEIAELEELVHPILLVQIVNKNNLRFKLVKLNDRKILLFKQIAISC